MNLLYKYHKRSRVSSRSAREGVISGEDLISLLPDPLLCHILSFLTTEEAVWTSVLSSRWRHLWKWVPRLELDSSDFTNDQVCVDFIDKFLAFQGKSYLREFKLTIDQDVCGSEITLYPPCLGRVDMRKLERYQVENTSELGFFVFIRLTLSACEALVCLKLHYVWLNDDLESLSLPCLKIMFLEDVGLPSDAAAEALISSSPVLEVLKICLSKYDAVVALRVRSVSLKSFTLRRAEPLYARGRSVVIDAPKLEYLSLMDYYHFKRFEITSAAESFKVDIDVEFKLMNDYLLEKKIIGNLLKNFSGVKDMTMSWRTLQFIYSFHRTHPLPKFHGLTRLRATMCLNASPELLPVLLESCPNLKHLTLELFLDPNRRLSEQLSTVRLPRCLVSSLESVEMESPVTEIATELDLARYFMKNSTTLKKLVLRLNNKSTGEKHKPGVLERLVKYSRSRCSLSQFEVLPVVPTRGYVYGKSNRF
ncbi:F-box/FBD/LRR-repeat protein [Raphanus sativus]|uniref:F-box/FBD/LRR-repeat protein At5g18770 n=1 Tax=Raphanus sativus TaxID=3726 RepID=A0A9W3DBZ9_RAPSA|nr:F-box/FBD/LRR-repeat protein At5g18770 [Raphanus sativus]KAJ4908169.1 F-box/FBD/LRR-repeat protein [Raphanus sativus]